MTSAQSDRFSARCLESSAALWPGSVQIGSSTTQHPASVVVGAAEATVNADGLQAEEVIIVEIAADRLASAPTVGQMIQDVATGKRYEIYRVLVEGGRYLIRGAIFPTR